MAYKPYTRMSVENFKYQCNLGFLTADMGHAHPIIFEGAIIAVEVKAMQIKPGEHNNIPNIFKEIVWYNN